MKTLKLIRFKRTNTCIIGTIADEAGFSLFTLEDLWRNNESNVSCIPKGTYHCTSHNGRHFKDVWRLLNVPNRTAVLIHSGNTHRDTQGCILVGLKQYGEGIVHSLDALQKLKEYIGRDNSGVLNDFMLQITETA